MFQKILSGKKKSEPKQIAWVLLRINESLPPSKFKAEVTRITPFGIRLELEDLPEAEMKDLFYLNPEITIELEMPKPARTVQSVAIIEGLTECYGETTHKLLIDADFPELSQEEEELLKDSNPMLVVN